MKDNYKQTISNKLRILYPVWVLVGMLSLMYIPSTLIESGNAQTTIANITANELLFRVGIVGRILVLLLYILIPLLLYRLLEDTNKNQAALMVVSALISVPVSLYNETNQLAVLEFLHDPQLAMTYLDAYFRGLTIAMIFWGLWLFPLGYLVYKSSYFPQFIGVCLYIGGFGYLLGAFLEILFPEASPSLSAVFEIMTIGEMIFILWFIIKGIKKTDL